MAWIDRRIGAQMARNNRRDTPAAIATRLRRNAALEQLRAEIAAKYPTLNADNAAEACEFQARRMRELFEIADQEPGR